MNDKLRASSLVCGALVIANIAGCGAGSDFDSGRQPGGNAQDLYGWLDPNAQAAYWNAAEGQAPDIPVCWTANAAQGRGTDGVLLGAPFPGFANAKAWMREIVEDGWGRAANIFFTGWDNICKSSGQGDDADRALNPNTIMFAFLPNSATVTDGRWFTDIDGRSPLGGTMIRMNRNSSTKDSYRYPSLHEMGHALGFAHEQTRPDNWVNGNPTTCLNHNVGEGAMTGGTYYTSWIDNNSVMCYDVTPSQLSPGDIMGIQKRYGWRPAGSLVGFHGMCANILGGSTADGVQVGAWPCTGGWNDTFFRPNDTLEHLQTPANSKCLNVSGGTAPNPIISWSCGNFNNEHFVFGNATGLGAELRALGGLCVQMSGGHPQVAVCNGSASQKWDLQHPTGSIRTDQIQYLGSSGQCLTTATTTGALGEQLTTAACSSTDVRQRFIYPGGGVIKMANNPHWCLNVSGGLPVAGSVVALWDGCDAAPPLQNEQFLLHGRVRALNNCLTVQNSAAPGDIIKAQACDANNTTSQLWDYYL